MKRFLHQGLAALAALALLTPLTNAQSNTIPGLDVLLGFLDGINDLGRTGTFPNGRNGFAMSTTSCNPGTVEASWEAAMDPDHPFICFIMARESGGRMVQISNYSRVKHGFFALSSNQCGLGCAGTNGDALGLGCSDTYGVGTNGGRNNLGPPEEINPWLGEWNVTCSLFDGPDCDNQRDYFGTEPNGVNGRVEVEDADLDVAGARFFYYSNYLVEGEAEANRANNHGWHEASITWNGSSYNSSPIGGGGTPTYGTILDGWTGATVNSNTNGASDGRVYVASKTSPAGSNTHYEYAVHNRDNARAVDSFRVPIAPGTNVSGFGFHDIDQNAGNDWSAAVVGNEVVFSTTSNPLMWNSIFNFWFDADISPVTNSVAVDQHFAGAGLPSILITAEIPGGGVIAPCSQADDGLEENDSCAAATVVANGAQNGLFVTKTDEDWYRIGTEDGDVLTLTTTFSHASGDIDIELYDACGNPFILNAQSTTDNEQVSITNNTGGPEDYFLRVFVFATSTEDCNNYNLDVSIAGIPMGCDVADALEPNDTCAGASPQGAGSFPSLTVQDVDDDWYEVTLVPGQTLSATMNFSNGAGDLDMELFATCGAGFIDNSDSVTNSENVGVTNNTASNQDYFIRCFVWNDNVSCNSYDLTIDLIGGDPCLAQPADSFEDNDSCASAVALGSGFEAALTVSKTDHDWYEIVVPSTAVIDVDLFFSNSTADIDVYLYDACGGTELVNGFSGNDNESITWTNNTGSSLSVLMRVEVWANSAGDCNDYDMDVDVQGGPPANLVPFCFGDGSGTACPCSNNSTSGHGGGCGNSSGNGVILLASGNPSVSNDTLSFTTNNGIPVSLCVLFSADNQLGGGNGILGSPPTDGLRCIGGALLRHGNRVIQGSGSPNNPWGAGGAPAGGLISNAAFTAGQIRHFAMIYRDFNDQTCFTGLNTSNAITVTMVP